MYKLSEQSVELIEIFKKEVAVEIVSDQIKTAIESFILRSKNKTLTIKFNRDSFKNQVIKKQDILSYNVELIGSCMYLIIKTTSGKNIYNDIQYIDCICSGRSIVIWNSNEIPKIEVKQVKLNKKVCGTDCESYHIAIINNRNSIEYKGLGIKGNQSIYLHCIPNDSIIIENSELESLYNELNEHIKSTNKNIPLCNAVSIKDILIHSIDNGRSISLFIINNLSNGYKVTITSNYATESTYKLNKDQVIKMFKEHIESLINDSKFNYRF